MCGSLVPRRFVTGGGRVTNPTRASPNRKVALSTPRIRIGKGCRTLMPQIILTCDPDFNDLALDELRRDSIYGASPLDL